MVRFGSGIELRSVVEQRVGRRLTSQEWSEVDQEAWSAGPGDYDEQDLEDLLERARKLLHENRKPRSQRVRESAFAHTRYIAAEVSELVATERRRLFGSQAAPFKTAAETARWIERNEIENGRMLVALTVELPAQDYGVQLLRELRDWLSDRLDAVGPQAGDDALLSIPGLRSFCTPNAVLPYLPGDAHERKEIGVKRVCARPGSVLEDVLFAAERIEKLTGWALVACVHHLFTGGVMSAPLEATPSVHAARGAPLRESVDIHVPFPGHVDVDTVASGYAQARKGLPSHRKRARTPRRNERLVEFVRLHPTLTWLKRMELWNKHNAEDLFRTPDAMRAAYGRAK